MATRPLGASFADWVAVEHSRGGLAWGTRLVSVIGLLVIAACVAGPQVAWSRSRNGERADVVVEVLPA